jgi:hypothetical protein
MNRAGVASTLDLRESAIHKELRASNETRVIAFIASQTVKFGMVGLCCLRNHDSQRETGRERVARILRGYGSFEDADGSRRLAKEIVRIV